MSELKSKLINQAGFTITELMVVIVIFITLSSVVILQWNSQTPNRSLNIAQNELVTNLRKAQSYTLSSRNIATSNPAKFYLVRVATAENTYTINGVDSNYNYYPSIETVSLPSGLDFGSLSLYDPANGSTTVPACALLIFSAPFGKLYLEGAATCDSSITTTLQNLATLTPKADKQLTITIRHIKQGATRAVVARGLTGRIDNN